MHERLFEERPDPSIGGGFVVNELCGEEGWVDAHWSDGIYAGQALFARRSLRLANSMGSIRGARCISFSICVLVCNVLTLSLR
jgi:hypothetical protein